MQKILNIESPTLDDSWFQLVINALHIGRDFKIDEGSFAGSTRKEFDFVVVHIWNPGLRCVDGLPLIPVMPEGSTVPPPVDKDYLINYVPYILGSEVNEKESYTYGQRLNRVRVSLDEGRALGMDRGREIYKDYLGSPLENVVHDAKKFLDQVSLACWTYKNNGHRNNQMCLQVAQPKDMMLLDPPCLRHIDTRIQDGKLHFYPYFRSWDLWSGYPANVAGISMLQEHMAQEIGVEQGEMICTSKGLHLYDYAVSFAEMRCMIDGKC